MLGQRTLLVNPPPVGGIVFTRQGRCQEREEVLGTSKPPYTLALAAALLRTRGCEVRLVDLTAERLSTAGLVDRLDGEGFRPTLIVFCSTTPTLEADAAAMGMLKARWGAPLISFGPHASCAPAESMAKAPGIDGMLVGEPEEGIVQLAGLASFDDAAAVPSLTFRRHGAVVPHRVSGTFAGFVEMPHPAWYLIPLERYRLPIVDKPYVLVETSRGCPYSCDFCVVPVLQGHKFRERPAEALVNEIARLKREQGIEYFYLWGDTVTLNVKSFGRFCDELIARDLGIRWFANSRADSLVDEAFVHRLKRAGCWMLSLGIESESDEVRRDMLKRLERRKIEIAIANLRRAGIKSFAFFIFGYPGETPDTLERTTRYALELDPDFANFYPAVPYPGTELYDKCIRLGLLAPEEADWSKMEYSYYLLKGNGLDHRTVMRAINRARRRFYLRPAYLARHFGDLARLAYTKRTLVWQMAARMLFGVEAPAAHRAAARPLPEGTPLAVRELEMPEHSAGMDARST